MLDKQKVEGIRKWLEENYKSTVLLERVCEGSKDAIFQTTNLKIGVTEKEEDQFFSVESSKLDFKEHGIWKVTTGKGVKEMNLLQ